MSAANADMIMTLAELDYELDDITPESSYVDIPLSLALVDRLDAFRKIAVRYAAILASGVAPALDVGPLKQYEEFGRLLSRSHGIFASLYGGGVAEMFRIFKKANETSTDEIDTPQLMRNAHFAIELMAAAAVDMDAYEYQRETKTNPHEEKARLLADPAAFRCAIDEVTRKMILKEMENGYD